MGSQKINKEESTTHKLRAAMRFLKHLHQEIKLAEQLEDIKDKAILDKLAHHIEILNDELKDKL